MKVLESTITNRPRHQEWVVARITPYSISLALTLIARISFKLATDLQDLCPQGR